MEEILGGFGWIAILVIGYLFRYAKKSAEENQQNTDKKTIEQKIKSVLQGNFTQAETRNQYDGKIVDNSPDNYQIKQETLEQASQSLAEQKTSLHEKLSKKENPETLSQIMDKRKREKEQAIKKNKQKSTSNKKMSKDGSYLGDFSEQELIMGVIFKEILDRPRSKKPFQPHNWSGYK